MLNKEIEKDVFCLVTSVGQRKILRPQNQQISLKVSSNFASRKLLLFYFLFFGINLHHFNRNIQPFKYHS